MYRAEHVYNGRHTVRLEWHKGGFFPSPWLQCVLQPGRHIPLSPFGVKHSCFIGYSYCHDITVFA